MRIGPSGRERPVVRVDEHTYIDVSDLVEDYNEAFFAAGGPHLLQQAVAVRRATGTVHPFGTDRIGAPIARPHQILGVGANYRSPGSNAPAAQDPLVFSKAPNSLSGPYDPVHIPRDSTHTDWEVELGVVIGTRSHYLADDEEASRACGPEPIAHGGVGAPGAGGLLPTPLPGHGPLGAHACGRRTPALCP
ncbi:fumarylacetoacetate hydrolase family protein [Streptomyces mutomycini]|uniref:Fumarylacetoacetate hydrolase family protein n=1 Tax=Streptomyces mutomycini TaxID=284036 RepID=A0ABW0BAS6_9ACTN|nr:fumarylacetoacetate hydrolase family protein [Streptomyces mutomycini]